MRATCYDTQQLNDANAARAAPPEQVGRFATKLGCSTHARATATHGVVIRFYYDTNIHIYNYIYVYLG
jgi:hypothetical protein